MFAPSRELVQRYADTIVSETEPAHRATQQLIRDYALKNFTGERNGHAARVVILVFRGTNAAERMRQTVGHISHEETRGETIRDTFGDYITDDVGRVTYFEPGVVAAFNPKAIERDLKLWAEFSDRDAGVLDQAVQFPAGAKIEKTLVLIKPDNFKFPNVRPGAVIEVFSRTGLYIVGFKVHRMSVAQAEDFYGPVLPVLQEKLGHAKGQRNASRWFIKARTPFAKFAKYSARLIRPRRRRARFEKNLVKPLWSTPRTPPIRSKTPGGKWESSAWRRIILKL
jgi:nucleoside diphosphate kinase